ncbi:MAG: single-stranded-DNA-specific exonuclease RecJ [Oscillospiraceae bacterium]|nr:single-stranded-DNA-specific exonuclease RecJ [Oscillospiraceae bacterium]
MLYRKWKVKEFADRQVNSLAGELGVDSLLAKVLLARDVHTRQQATTKYLDAAPLSDPFLMKDMDKAVDRIMQAVENEEKIVIYGDYDVDGVCATATLFSYLESIGANVFYKLPNRENEGYGLNSRVLKKFKDKGVGLVVTVDNGISAIDEVAYANSIGLDIVITDHHLPKKEIPKALAVVDPLQPDDTSPCKILAGVGVAFKLVCALEGASCEEMLDFYADFVCVGTVADLMLLEGENRTMVKAGLEILNSRPRCGFESLLKISGILGKEVTSENIAYTIAPRINAAGRMSDATSALELLLSEDEEDADNLAMFLDNENKKRQDTQNKMAEDITNEILANGEMMKDRVIVVWGDEYHPGVVGIVASRLVERYARPAIVFTKDGDEYKGSGRSVPAFSLHNALDKTKEYLIRFGGHELAAGLAVEKENLENFRRAINEFALKDENMSKTADLDIDCLVSLSEINTRSVSQVDFLAPFGNGNQSPLFMAKNLQITAVFPVSDGKHVRIKMRQGNNINQGIMFNVTPGEFAYKPGDYIDACFSLSIFQGETGDMVSMRIKEVRPVGITDRMIDEYDIYRLFLNDFSLSPDKKSILCPIRNDVAQIYRRIIAEKVNCDDLRPLFVAFSSMSSGKIQVIIDVLQDLGLIEIVRTDIANYFAPVAVKEKKDLMSSKILLSLQ